MACLAPELDSHSASMEVKTGTNVSCRHPTTLKVTTSENDEGNKR